MLCSSSLFQSSCKDNTPDPALTHAHWQMRRVGTRAVEITLFPRLGHASMTGFPRTRWGGIRRNVSTQHPETGLERSNIHRIRRISIRYIVDDYLRISFQPFTEKLRHLCVRPVPGAEIQDGGPVV
jgi:hypothetical protein